MNCRKLIEAREIIYINDARDERQFLTLVKDCHGGEISRRANFVSMLLKKRNYWQHQFLIYAGNKNDSDEKSKIENVHQTMAKRFQTSLGESGESRILR